jgi:cyclophilin family peptidyl-prolyl cis-trans isomerase
MVAASGVGIIVSGPPILRSLSMRFLAFVALIMGAVMTTTSGGAAAADPENTLYMDLESGRVVIELRNDLAPGHVDRIKELTREGFYDGVVFHRVIEGFMAQTGDPTGTGRGGSGEKLRAEFTDTNFGRGTVGMARAQDPNSGDSQFFICFNDCSFLNGQYTVWGQVSEGMELVDGIKRGEPPREPDHIVKMQVGADAQ